MLKHIYNDKILSKLIVVLDHHISDFNNNKYNFVSIVNDNKFGKCCGTSLFLEYLKNNYNFKFSPAVETFVELTRQYDTWEWKTKFNNDEPNNLNLFFSAVGIENYVTALTNKLKTLKIFEFSESELKIISDKKTEISTICKSLKAKLKITDFENLIIGYVFDTDGKYRNEFAEYLKDENFNIDIMLMLNMQRNTASFRAINPSVNVGNLVKKFNGKGHKASGGCPISDELFIALNLPKNENLV